MVKDYIDYAELIDKAMQNVVKMAIEDVAQYGLPSDHHFFITFKTRADGVMISEELLKKYPEEMTIVIQHQYFDLEVTDVGFSIVLSFNHVKHNLTIPFSSLVSFVDPSVKFGLQFALSDKGLMEELEFEEIDDSQNKQKPIKKTLKKDKVTSNEPKVNKPNNSNVVTLDSFRNKK